MAEIRKATKEDIRLLVEIYAEFFPEHNIFSDKNYSSEYIEENIEDFIVLTYADDILGGLRIVKKQETQNHHIIRFKHIAVKGKDEESMAELVSAAEEIAGPGKIELHIAETEEPNRLFFEKLGYVLEGTLNDHYRKGEKCYLLGKYKGE